MLPIVVFARPVRAACSWVGGTWGGHGPADRVFVPHERPGQACSDPLVALSKISRGTYTSSFLNTLSRRGAVVEGDVSLRSESNLANFCSVYTIELPHFRPKPLRHRLERALV
jgi:hypothetical protein